MKDIKGYEGLYAITSCGKVWSYRSNKFLKPKVNKSGYLQVSLYKNYEVKNPYIHRLVAEAYIPNPENKPQINHLNEQKDCNWVKNLEWCTAKENNNYGTHNERMAKALSKTVRCLETNKVYESTIEAAKAFNVSASGIARACRNNSPCVGYHFEFVEKIKEETVEAPKKKGTKAVYCIETNEVYESQTIAAQVFNINSSTVSKCCSGRLKSAKGYHFRFATEEEIMKYNLKKSMDELTEAVVEDMRMERMGLGYNVPDTLLKVAVS